MGSRRLAQKFGGSSDTAAEDIPKSSPPPPTGGQHSRKQIDRERAELVVGDDSIFFSRGEAEYFWECVVV